MRSAVIVIALVACGGHAAAPQRATVKTAAGSDRATSAGSGSSAPVGPVAVKDIGCLQPTCAFHAGAAAYFTCLAGGAGACFHFGGPCAPPDGCMYDPGDRTYKMCQRPVEGRCAAWAAACTPTTSCVFGAADGLYHRCDEPAPGTCKKYGELCAP